MKHGARCKKKRLSSHPEDIIRIWQEDVNRAKLQGSKKATHHTLREQHPHSICSVTIIAEHGRIVDLRTHMLKPSKQTIRAMIAFSGTPQQRHRLQRIALDHGMKVQHLLETAIDHYLADELREVPIFSVAESNDVSELPC